MLRKLNLSFSVTAMSNLIFVLLIFFQVQAYAEVPTWETNEQAAQVKTIMASQSGNMVLFAMLTVDYNFKSKCADAFVSVLSVKTKKLGKLISTDFADASKEKNKLNFILNGKIFDYSTEKTLRAIYDNGVEFGVLPPMRLVEDLKNNMGNLEVRIGSSPIARFEKTHGLAEALVHAKANCLSKIKNK